MSVFVDTNVLVYAEDRDAGRRHEIARDLVVELWQSRDGVVSIQVLQELFVMLTRKVPNPLSSRKAEDIVRQYLKWRVVENDGELLLNGIAMQRGAKVSFWDALVVQAAVSAGCERLYTEDLNHGQRIGEVEVVNPFVDR